MLPCRHLNDHLLGCLDDSEEQAFLAHLLKCKECRSQVEEQQQLNRLLSSVVETETAPPGLSGQIQRRLQRERSRAQRKVAVVALAASIFVALTAWMALPETGSFIEVRQHRISWSPPQPEVPAVEVRFVPETKVIAIPVETDDPEITFLRVYPTSSVGLQVSNRSEKRRSNE